eukprot:gene20675-24779_t
MSEDVATPEEHSGDSILWDPDSFHKRRSPIVPVPKFLVPDETFSNITAETAVEGLRVDDYLVEQQTFNEGVKGVILIIGGTDDLTDFIAQQEGHPELPEGVGFKEAIQRLKLTFSRGITRAAYDTHSVVVTSGFDSGAVGYLGRANKDRHHRIPLVGVVGSGLTTWPGDAKESPEQELKSLQPDHTHYVMLNTAFDEFAVRKFRFDVAVAFRGKDGSKLPLIAVVVNGGREELEEMLLCVRWNIPVVVIKGSGGIADVTAKEMDNPDIDDFVVDEKVLEIVKEGNVEALNLKDIDGAVVRDLVKRLFGGDPGVDNASLRIVWELYGVYFVNRQQNASSRDLYFLTYLFLSVLLSTMVTMRGVLGDLDVPEAIQGGNEIGILLLPIIISVILLLDNRGKPAMKAKVLLSGSGALESEIYTYRAGMGSYLGVAAGKVDQVLADKAKTIQFNVMDTVVAEGHLDQIGSQQVKDRNYRVNDRDDGISKLSPENYMQFRSNVLLQSYEVRAFAVDRAFKRCLCAISILIGLKIVLGLLPFMQPFNVLTVAVTFALMLLIEYSGYAVKLGAYNRAATELRNTVSWWRALSPIEQANPQNFYTLVQKTESIWKNENSATNPGTDMTGGGGGGDGGDDGLDVNLLGADILDNLDKDGKIAFASAWINSHPAFFEGYNAWLEQKLEMSVKSKIDKGEKVEIGGGGNVNKDEVVNLTQEDPAFALSQLQEARAHYGAVED